MSIPRILFIEPSVTLHHVIRRAIGKDYEVILARSYEQGIEMLQESVHKPLKQRWHGVILGWPGETQASADQSIILLDEPQFRHLPVLVLALDKDAAILNWVVKRRFTALLRWEDYNDCALSLEKLLSSSISNESKFDNVDSNIENKNIRVLFVDDSPTVRALFKNLLLKNGYEAETVASIKEALHKAQNQHYDIAIVDYFMPGGNGDELCRKLRDDVRTASILVAIFTGIYHDQVIKDALDAGAMECMFKNEANELFIARMEAMTRVIYSRRSVEKEQKRLEGILSSVGDGVYGVNNEGKITFINPAAKKILGYTTKGLGFKDPLFIEKTPHELFHYANAEGTAHTIESCFLTQAYGLGDVLHGWETVFWSAKKKPIPVECTVYPLYIEGNKEGAVIAFRDISERKLLEEELKWRINHDHLTKLPNRYYFDEELKKEVWRLKRSEEVSALLYMDLDRFKYINDTAGHSAGDKLLVEVGRQLSTRLRKSDMLARLGGDEFAILLRNIGEADAYNLAEQFLSTLRDYEFCCVGKQYKVDGSIGIALISRHVKSPDEVLSNADIACHLAKQKGTNQCHIYVAESDEKEAMDMDLGWSARLHHALETDQFVLFFQPIIPIAPIVAKELPQEGGDFRKIVDVDQLTEPVHYEVLVRMRNATTNELIAPNAFIPTAERFNMMRQIDRWIFIHALQALQQQQQLGNRIHLGINLSGNSMDDDKLLPFITEMFAKYDIDTDCVLFEITETSAISNIRAAQKLIQELRGLGCRFALDDFGCGFSSFSHLKHLPVDFIKIDGMFVQGMVSDPMDQAMVRAVNDIAHSTGKKTIAEYVENAEIVKLLSSYGVDYIQGYYVGKPSQDF